MQRTLLSLAVVGSLAATLSAQCVAPVGTQTLRTIDFVTSTTFYANLTPPLYGVVEDPGPGVRFDLTLQANTDITSIATNILNDGTSPAGVPVPNLVGTTATMEVWAVLPASFPMNTVLDPTIFVAPSAPPYQIGLSPNNSSNPLTPMGAPWVRLSNTTTHINNMLCAAPDADTLATFTPPISLTPGQYAIMLVLVPQLTSQGLQNGSGLDRIHPLFTNLNTFPGPSSVSDSYVAMNNIGVTSPADANGVLSPAGATPYMPHVALNYTIAPNTAYTTAYGTGCYDGKLAFYESFSPPLAGIDIDPVGSAGAINGMDATFIGNRYIVSPGTGGLFVAPGSSVGATQWNTLVPALDIGSIPWDDSSTGAILLPGPLAPFPHPANLAGTNIVDMGSNGMLFLDTATNPVWFADSFNAFMQNTASIAACFSDFRPADLNTFQGGTGNLWTDTDNATYFAATWDGCEMWQEPANLSTCQVVLFPGGNWQIRFGAGGVNSGGQPALVGYSPGNGNPDPGTGPAPRQAPDLSAAMTSPGGYLSGDGTAPAVIRLSNRPKVGDPLTFNVQNSEPTSLFNLFIVSTSSLPGIDLAFLGMAGCNAYVNLPAIETNFLPTGSPWAALAAIPAAFAGANLFAQAAEFVTNPVNALQVRSTDAICIHFDNN